MQRGQSRGVFQLHLADLKLNPTDDFITRGSNPKGLSYRQGNVISIGIVAPVTDMSKEERVRGAQARPTSMFGVVPGYTPQDLSAFEARPDRLQCRARFLDRPREFGISKRGARSKMSSSR